MKKERVLKFEVCVNVNDRQSKALGNSIADKISDALFEQGIASKVTRPAVKAKAKAVAKPMPAPAVPSGV